MFLIVMYTLSNNRRLNIQFPATLDQTLGHCFRFAYDRWPINNTSASWLLVRRPSKQEQIPIRIFDYEILRAPRLLL
jgi:hypothetical protein